MSSSAWTALWRGFEKGRGAVRKGGTVGLAKVGQSPARGVLDGAGAAQQVWRRGEPRSEEPGF